LSLTSVLKSERRGRLTFVPTLTPVATPLLRCQIFPADVAGGIQTDPLALGERIPPFRYLGTVRSGGPDPVLVAADRFRRVQQNGKWQRLAFDHPTSVLRNGGRCLGIPREVPGDRLGHHAARCADLADQGVDLGAAVAADDPPIRIAFRSQQSRMLSS
jgi:hypothetical protein